MPDEDTSHLDLLWKGLAPVLKYLVPWLAALFFGTEHVKSTGDTRVNRALTYDLEYRLEMLDDYDDEMRARVSNLERLHMHGPEEGP